jgi:glutamate-5-semialdehyde dehydrogenase
VLAEIMAGVKGLPSGAIELLDSGSRDTVQELIRARGLVDVVIPRGGPGLITHVMENALVPVIETGAGNCHIFVDESADFEMANRIILNAKTQRPSVCNAAEKLLVHSAVSAKFIPQIARKLIEAGVELRGDEATRQIEPSILPATEQDWSEEYLRLCMAIHIVAELNEAIEHINRYSTKHSEAIITENKAHAETFLQLVDSAAVYWNASTRFTDGGEFGFGAEMGVSTQKLHCRGPFALKELTSTKYQVIGSGQTRG